MQVTKLSSDCKLAVSVYLSDLHSSNQLTTHALTAKFESGTAATIVELAPAPGTTEEDIDAALDINPYLQAQRDAPDLQLSDVMLTPDDESNLRKQFVWEAMKVLVEHGAGGQGFKRYKKREL